MYTITLRDAATGTQLLNVNDRATDITIADNQVSFNLRLDLALAAGLIDDFRVRHVCTNRFGVTKTYLLQRPTLTTNGIQCIALNLISVLNMDNSYSALWSDSNVGSWIETPETISNRNPKLYGADKQNRLFVGLQKGTVYRNGMDAWGWSFYSHIATTKQPIVTSYRYTIDLPSGWVVSFQRINRSGGYLTTIRDVTSAGSVISGALCDTYTGTDGLEIVIYNASGSSYTMTGENGTKYVNITSMRVATTTANLINTTVAGAISTGSQVITPASMTNIVVGQLLTINTGASDSEAVVVTAVTATTFTATFAKSHLANATVRAIVVRDSEVVGHMLAQAVALNSLGLSASTLLVSTSSRDYDDLAFVSAGMLDVLDQLAKPAGYSFGVQEDGLLWYGVPTARSWMVQAADVTLCRPVDRLANNVSVLYRNAAGIDQLTSAATDTVSIAQNGYTQRLVLNAQTTIQREAELIRDTALADGKARSVEAQVSIARLYDAGGTRYPVDMIAPGDTISIANLSPVLSSPELRTFTVGDVGYNPLIDRVDVALDMPLPRLDILLAQLAI